MKKVIIFIVVFLTATLILSVPSDFIKKSSLLAEQSSAKSSDSDGKPHFQLMTTIPS